MNGTTHKIRRVLTAMALSATAALLVVPLAQARDNIVDDWFRDATVTRATDHILDVSARDAVQAPSSQPSHRTDGMFQDSLVSAQAAAAQANDHILDVSSRDTAPVRTTHPRAAVVVDDYFRDNLVNASKANDTILDVSARDSRTAALIAAGTGGSTDWQKIGLGMALGGGLLLLIAVGAGLEFRHTRRLGNA